MRVLRFVLAIVVAFFWAIPLWCCALVAAPFDKRRDWVNLKIGRLWTGAWKWVLGIRVRVEGERNIREGGPFLFIANHASYLDALALYDDFPIMPRFLAKKNLIWVPIFGIAFFTLDHVYIERRKSKRQLDSIRALAAKTKRGKSVFIFPGGKRAPDGRLGEWKKGAFVMAIELGIPIVPVAIVGSAKLHGIGDVAVTPGTIEIRIGRPLPTTGLTYEHRNEMLQRARRAVEELFDNDANE